MAATRSIGVAVRLTTPDRAKGEIDTPLERTGDFSGSVDAAGRQIVIYDPRTTRPDLANAGQSIRDPFPGNIIPSDRSRRARVAEA